MATVGTRRVAVGTLDLLREMQLDDETSAARTWKPMPN
jgi:hypothetical protein